MNFISKFVTVFVILIICFCPVPSHSSASTTLSNTKRINFQEKRISSFKEGVSQYSTHDPIFIDGNVDFQNLSSTEGWVGEGVISNPYIIEGYNISGHADVISIEIRNIDLHFVINNCYFSYGLSGIYLNNVSNCYINTTTIEYMSGYDPPTDGIGFGGIILERCNNITVRNNIVRYQVIPVNDYEPGVGALWVWGSKQCTIENNTIAHMYWSIISSSENIKIFKNLIKRCPIWLIDSRSISFRSNQILSGQDRSIAPPYGVGIGNLNDSIVVENIVRDSNDIGIKINGRNILISNNEIINNTIGGVCASGVNVTISENVFIDNGYGVETSSSCIIKWNNFIGDNASGYGAFDYNFWDSWTSPDNNDDGIVDNPFPIMGGDNMDYHPLVLPIQVSMWRPKVIFPKGGEIISGKVVIYWDTMGGISFPNLTSYSIYYSSNEGSSWVEVVSNIQETNYSWDTTVIPDWTNSLIKIVATHPDGTSLQGFSSRFFTVVNDPQILESLDQGIILAGPETYELTLYLDNKAFTGITSLSFSSTPSITTQFGTYSSVTLANYSDCTLYSGTDYIGIGKWNSYYDNKNANLVKSEISWSIHVLGYQQTTITMMYEYGNYKVIADNASAYEETYTQHYYEDGVFQETLHCRDITTFDEIETIRIEAGKFDCIRMRTVNYEGVLEPDECVGYSLFWIDKNGSLIKESAFDVYGNLSLSMALKVTKSSTSSSSAPKGTPAWTFVIVTIILAIIVFPKKRG
ncbi:MAG: nitrous oxide reductase family maturation protein NosD [Candidatus Hodarchaeota archaeon]